MNEGEGKGIVIGVTDIGIAIGRNTEGYVMSPLSWVSHCVGMCGRCLCSVCGHSSILELWTKSSFRVGEMI